MKTLTELLEQRSKLLEEVESADEKRFAQIKIDMEKLDFQITEAKAAEQRKAEEELAANARAARPINGENNNDPNKVVLFDTAKEGRSNDMSAAEDLRTAKIAFGKQVRAALTNIPVNLSAGEKRALGISLTTTSQTYTAPTDDANGVNNGGVFIPQTVMDSLLEIDTPDSPFLRDVEMQQVKGALVFPYKIEATNGNTKSKGEGKAADDRSIKWGRLTLPQGNYPLTIEVTMELLSMTDEKFTDYLLKDLVNEINLLLTEEVFYGTGKENRIEGVTLGAIKGTAYEAGKEAEAIKAGLLKLSNRARRGAKVYISRSMSLDMAFEKDTTGNYIFPIYNNIGIEKIATIPVEVDETLQDGDFIIGNATNYLLNMTSPTEVYAELHGKTRIIEYTAHLMVAGKAAPNKFYYGKKTADSTTKE